MDIGTNLQANMSIILRILLTLTLPIGTWLLLNGPSLNSSGVRIVFLVMIFFQLSWVWMKYVTFFFRGDEYTYGIVISSLSAASCIVSTATGVTFLYARQFKVDDFHAINFYIYLVWLACLVLMWALPIASTSSPERLPKKNERREFEKLN